MMTRSDLDVTYKPVDATRIPDTLIEGASLLVDLQRRGMLKQVAEHLRIRRQGGFCGLEVWLMLFLSMTQGAATGVRKF